MIPSHWFRRILYVLFVLEVLGGILWVATHLLPDPADEQLAQTLAGLVFLFGLYAGSPVMARFLAPVATRDQGMQERLAKAVTMLPGSRPVVLYDHADKEANTVGLWAGQSRIYLTTGLLGCLSDEGLKGVLAHENTHIREYHILLLFAYACLFVMGSHLIQSDRFFFAGFLLFLMLRRYSEYRADAGAARMTGLLTMLTTLQELAILYPSKAWHRWFSFASAYPTTNMRRQALETGRKALV